MKRTSNTEIIDSAAAFLAQHPDAPLEDVAEAAGIGRATLYRRFPSRNALIKEIALSALRDFDTISDSLASRFETPSEMLRALLAELIPLGNKYHFLIRQSAAYDNDVMEIYSRQLSDMERLIKGVQLEGRINKALKPSWIVAYLDSLIWATWHAIGTDPDDEGMPLDMALDFIFKGFAPD